MALSLAIQIVYFAPLTQDGICPVKTCGFVLRSYTTRTAPIVQIFKTSQRLHRVHLHKAFTQGEAKREKESADVLREDRNLPGPRSGVQNVFMPESPLIRLVDQKNHTSHRGLFPVCLL